MTKREKFLQVAHTWVGVPWCRVGSRRDGVNCLGLLVGVARECDFDMDIADKEAGATFTTSPIRGFMLKRAREDLDTIHMKDALPGDLILYRIGQEPQHIGIITCLKPLQILHSHKAAKRCVITPPLRGWYRTLVFRIRELDE